MTPTDLPPQEDDVGATASEEPTTATRTTPTRRGLRLFLLADLVVLAGLIYVRLTQPAVFRSESVLQYELELGVGSGVSEDDHSREEWFSTQDYLLTSNGVLDAVVDELSLQQNPVFMGLKRGKPARATHDDAVRKLRDSVSVHRLGGTRLVRVSLEHPDPKLAARVLNAVVESYLRTSFEDRLVSTQKAASWLEAKIDNAKNQLMRTEGELRTFLESNAESGLPVVERQRTVNTEIEQLSQEVVAARVRRIKLNAEAVRLKEAERSEPLELHGPKIDDNAQIQQLRSDYLAAVIKYQGVAAGQGAASQAAEQERSRLDTLRDQLTSTTRSIVRGVQAELAEAQLVEAQLNAELGRLNRLGHQLQLQELEVGRLGRERAATELMLTKLRDQSSATGAASANGLAAARVVETAKAPTEPISRFF